MSKSLIIAEKPSLAQKIVQAIGSMKKEKDYYENDNYIVTSVFGHILELWDLNEYLTKENPKVWEMEDLKFFPKEFKYKVKNDSGAKARYKLIKELIKRQDITTIINSGDADREGEVLINIVIYKIFEELKITKKVQRIWLEDQTENTIRKELKYPRDIKNTYSLYQEGLARTYVDWIYGIYLTRYISILTHTTYNTGRVIIPTVKYVYDRDMEIKNFVPEKYYQIATKINKDEKEIVLNFKDFKFNKEEKSFAEATIENLKDKKVIVKDIVTKDVKNKPKKLFSLATLQNYMNKKYKFSLDKTLSLVQSLYEKRLLTYPRTNTEYLSEEEIPKFKSLVEKLNTNYKDLEFNSPKSIFDSTKVESHSAITITETSNISGLTDDETKVYEAVKNRFLANFYKEECIVEETKIIFSLDGKETSIKGQSIKQMGYLKYENDLGEKEIPEFNLNEELYHIDKFQEKETTPPKKVTEVELNKFFEKPFKKIIFENNLGTEEETQDDTEDYKNILAGVEIGTPATRSGTIEKVKKVGYISADKNSLSITEKGINFIENLEKLNINLYAERTAELSQKLKQVYKNELSKEDLVKISEDEIKQIISQNVVGLNLKGSSNNKSNNLDSVGICPLCGKEIFENKKAFGCSGYKEGCKFVIWKTIAGKSITKTIAKELIKNGTTKKLDGFKSKAGKNFSAKIIIKEDGTTGFEF